MSLVDGVSVVTYILLLAVAMATRPRGERAACAIVVAAIKVASMAVDGVGHSGDGSGECWVRIRGGFCHH